MLISRYFTHNGDGATRDADGDYSGTAATFKIKRDPDKITWISRILVTIDSKKSPNPKGYGDGKDPLPNGILVRLVEDGEVISDLSEIPIKKNLDWARQCYDINTWGDTIHMRWSFFKFGEGRGLVLTPERDLEIVLRDDLKYLDGHFFVAQGQEFGTDG